VGIEPFGRVALNIGGDINKVRDWEFEQISSDWETKLQLIWDCVSQEVGEIIPTRLKDNFESFKHFWIEYIDSKTPPYTIKKGTRIMECLFTQQSFYHSISDILYLLNHCVLQTVNESVVESMVSMVGKHVSSIKGLSQSTLWKNQ